MNCWSKIYLFLTNLSKWICVCWWSLNVTTSWHLMNAFQSINEHISKLCLILSGFEYAINKKSLQKSNDHEETNWIYDTNFLILRMYSVRVNHIYFCSYTAIKIIYVSLRKMLYGKNLINEGFAASLCGNVSGKL